MKDTHKYIYFFIAFNLLSKGKPMTNYEFSNINVPK
jgi:hypothetical protein